MMEKNILISRKNLYCHYAFAILNFYLVQLILVQGIHHFGPTDNGPSGFGPRNTLTPRQHGGKTGALTVYYKLYLIQLYPKTTGTASEFQD